MIDTKLATPAAPAVRLDAERPRRATRTPFGGTRTKLSINAEIPGYHLHWVNDVAGRLGEAQQGGYVFVKPEEVGLSDTESTVKRYVGKDEAGAPIYAYLMKLETKFYEEDQKLYQRQVDIFDSAIKAGTLDQKPGDNRYDAGIHISGN